MVNVVILKQYYASYCLNKAEPVKPVENNLQLQSKVDFPLQGKCLATSIIYQASVTRHDNSHKEIYIGVTANSFKVYKFVQFI